MKTSIKFIVFRLLIVWFLSSCHTKQQVFHNMSTPMSIMPMPLKLADSSYAKTIPQPQPLKHAKILSKADYYQQAFDELKAMLEGQKDADFERAVFLSENPYYCGRFSYSGFQNSISAKQMFIEKLIEANDQSDTIDFNVHVNEYGRFKLADIRYLPHQKKELYRKALSNWAIFKYITDTVFIHTLKDSAFYTLYHAPYSYATADPFGIKNWSNSQVINLLISDDNKGNCFALTALYKILSDRLNADAKLCTAPQHIYIQHQDPKGQYYNVELATAGHPGDGIIQTLTYTPSEAIMSGIALRDYNTNQSIGLCLINLAKSYEHTFNTKDDEFLLHCAELALKHDSLNLNALLLKQQVLDTRVTQYAILHHLNSITKLKQDKGIMPLVNKLEKHLALLYQLGYREMPLDMQEQIMNPFSYDTKKWNHVSQNARPFTSFEPKDPKDAEYWTLTKGMFKEVWEPTSQEKYGHYTLTTATGKLKSMDTTSHKGQLIDPVAFAYDFGARIYDARVGRFLSIDPKESSYPSWSPYNGFMCNPIVIIDPDGKGGIVSKIRDPETGKVIRLEVSATIYIYSDVIKNQEEMHKISREIKSNIETNWNNVQTADKTGNATVTENGITVPVIFIVTVIPITREEAEKQLKSGKVPYGDNYVELTKGTTSKFDGNTGVFDIDQQNDKGNTWAHEWGHLLGYLTSKNKDLNKDNEFHSNDYDPSSQLPVPIMFRDLSSGYETSLDCARVVTQTDVDRLNKGEGVANNFLGGTKDGVPTGKTGNVGTNNNNKITQNGIEKN